MPFNIICYDWTLKNRIVRLLFRILVMYDFNPPPIVVSVEKGSLPALDPSYVSCTYTLFCNRWCSVELYSTCDFHWPLQSNLTHALFFVAFLWLFFLFQFHVFDLIASDIPVTTSRNKFTCSEFLCPVKDLNGIVILQFAIQRPTTGCFLVAFCWQDVKDVCNHLSSVKLDIGLAWCCCHRYLCNCIHWTPSGIVAILLIGNLRFIFFIKNVFVFQRGSNRWIPSSFSKIFWVFTNAIKTMHPCLVNNWETGALWNPNTNTLFILYWSL